MAKDTRRSKKAAVNKSEFDAFLKRGEERRSDLKEKQAAAKARRGDEGAARLKRAQADVSAEEALKEQRRQEMTEWRAEEQKRKEEIEADKKRRQEMEEALKKQQEERKAYEAQKKEYMRNLQWAAAIDRLKKRRDREAKEAKLRVINDAETEAKREKERIAQERRLGDHALVREAQDQRSEVDVEEERRIEKIDEDIKERKAKLYAKEQTEKTNVSAEMLRKRSLLRDITDASLKQRRKDELDREEKQSLQRIRTKYQQLGTALEIERNQRIDAEHKNAKKTRDLVAADERKALAESRQQASAAQAQADSGLAQKRREAKKLQSEILGMTFEEVAEWDEEQKKK